MLTIVRSMRLFFFCTVLLLPLSYAVAVDTARIVEETPNVNAAGERNARELAAGPPSRLARAKISMVGTKMVMGVRWSATQVFDVFQFRARWAEPLDWNDNWDESDRRFEIECWVQDDQTGNRKTLLKRQVGYLFSGYHEKYRFPPEMNLAMQCRVRAINTAGFNTPWRLTNRISVKDVPVYFPGVPGIDLRGLSEQDILAVLDKIAKEDGAQPALPTEIDEEASTTLAIAPPVTPVALVLPSEE